MLAEEWQSHLTAHATKLNWPSRIVVLESCESTQDEAAALFSKHQTELAVFALHQTKGRGRLGRAWQQHSQVSPTPLGLAVTFALSAQSHNPTWLPIQAAVAAKSACDAATNPPPDRILLKWPNDLVTREGAKLGGILVEKPAHTNALLLGIGINVSHTQTDLPLSLHATSLKLLTSQEVSPLSVAQHLLTQLAHWRTADHSHVEQAWKSSDALTGTTQTLSHDNQLFTGTILEISPTNHLRLQTPSGIITLPAATTSLVK